MDIIESPNDAGLNSLSGFSYQIKVFILKMTQLKGNQQVEFETLDDVTTRSLSADNTVTDFCIKRYVAAESSGIEVFQVKQTDVTKSVARKVLYNWLLAYNENSDITSFHLYVDDQYSVGINHLSYEQYYENIRQHYLRDAQKEKILSTERIANQNHKDVVLELQADGRDKPSLRLVKTKRAGISTMPNEFSRWGAYIFLTKDKLPNQISWKDENGESDE